MKKAHRLKNTDGTVWQLVRRTTYMNRDGEDLEAGVYARPCRTCGEMFEVMQVGRTTTRGNLGIAHCKAHRQAPLFPPAPR